jgi:hypothetical protein
MFLIRKGAERMKRKPKIYLETTMFNFYFEPIQDMNAHIATVKLFNDIQAGIYEAYTSIYVTDELTRASEPKRSNMMNLITDYNITVLPADDEADRIADIYVNDGVIPVKYRYDGLHIAVATINDLEYVFSLNYQHINKIKTKTMTSNINIREGYKPVYIASPMEV